MIFAKTYLNAVEYDFGFQLVTKLPFHSNLQKFDIIAGRSSS